MQSTHHDSATRTAARPCVAFAAFPMAPISSQDGPVAVTGAAGYIGSHLVKNLVEHGYTVRACVRDKTRQDKTAHLLHMNASGSAGRVDLVEADMLVNGSYDESFAGCSAVFHVAADIGTDSSYGQINPERMYKGLFEATENVLDSIVKAGSIKRLIYTSSCAAVMGPAPKGHEFTEDDWAGGSYETLNERWKGTWTIEKNACEYHFRRYFCRVTSYVMQLGPTHTASFRCRCCWEGRMRKNDLRLGGAAWRRGDYFVP